MTPLVNPTSSTGTVADPLSQAFAPGSFSVATGDYVVMTDQLELTNSQTVTLVGTAVLRVA